MKKIALLFLLCCRGIYSADIAQTNLEQDLITLRVKYPHLNISFTITPNIPNAFISSFRLPRAVRSETGGFGGSKGDEGGGKP